MATVEELYVCDCDANAQRPHGKEVEVESLLTGQATLLMHVSEHAHVVDNEALLLNRRLEAL